MGIPKRENSEAGNSDGCLEISGLNREQLTSGYGWRLVEHRFRVKEKAADSRFIWRVQDKDFFQFPSQRPQLWMRSRFQSIRVFREGEDVREVEPGLALRPVIADLEPDDIIEFCLSLKAEKDALGSHQVWTQDLRLDSPVAFWRLSLEHPNRMQVFYRVHGGESSAPERENMGQGMVSMSWESEAVPAVDVLDSVPRRITQCPWIQFSTFETWEQVAHLEADLWEPCLDGSDLVDWVQEFRNEASKDGDLLLEMSRYVQNSIATDLSRRAQQPAMPHETLKAGMGSARDKAAVLTAAARTAGFAAVPVLVSRRLQGGVAECLPSPDVFDHVVVCVEVEGIKYWVDPTLAGQAGSLIQLHTDAFGRGLAISRKTSKLITVPATPGSYGRLTVGDTYTFRTNEETVKLRVVTKARDFQADKLRHRLLVGGEPALAQAQLQLIRETYPDAERQSFKVLDSLETNLLTIEESFRMESLADVISSRDEAIMKFGPRVAMHLLGNVEDHPAQHPFELPPVGEVYHQILIKTPWENEGDQEHRKAAGGGIRFEFRSATEMKKAEISYLLTVRDSEVPVNSLEKFESTYARIANSYTYAMELQAVEKAVSEKNRKAVASTSPEVLKERLKTANRKAARKSVESKIVVWIAGVTALLVAAVVTVGYWNLGENEERFTPAKIKPVEAISWELNDPVSAGIEAVVRRDNSTTRSGTSTSVDDSQVYGIGFEIEQDPTVLSRENGMFEFEK